MGKHAAPRIYNDTENYAAGYMDGMAAAFAVLEEKFGIVSIDECAESAAEAFKRGLELGEKPGLFKRKRAA